MASKGKYAGGGWSLTSASRKKQPSGAKKKSAAPKKTPQPAAPPRLSPLAQAWEWVKTIFTWLVMALAVVVMIFTALSMRTLDQNDRDILGYKAFIVRSDSMSATDFDAGDLVLIRECDPATLVVGDIISFRSQDPASLGETFTHKIRRIDTDDYGIRTFTTYGTTTGVDDLYPVSQSNVLGRYLWAVPNAGSFFAFMKTTPGYLCFIGIPFLLMLLIQGGSVIRLVQQLYKEKQEEAQAEHQAKMDQLAAQQRSLDQQRIQMQQMLEEIKRLQSQMNASDP